MSIETPKQINIDVGGGMGEYLYEKAVKNPNQTFVILDPGAYRGWFEKLGDKKADNLSVIKWKSDVDSSLPFKDESINETNINFLFGEIQTREGYSKTTEEDIHKYARILRETIRVLKKGGKIKIIDVSGVIEYIKQALAMEGLTITSGPSALPETDRNVTKTSEAFSSVYEEGGKKADSFVLPMVIEVVK